MKTPIIIYLVQPYPDTADTEWCEDTEFYGIDKKDAISYVRADHVLETLQEYKKVTDLIDSLSNDIDCSPTPKECYDCPHKTKPCDSRQVDCPNAVNQ